MSEKLTVRDLEELYLKTIINEYTLLKKIATTIT